MFLFLEMSTALQCLVPPYVGMRVLHIDTCIFNTHDTELDLSVYISVL